MQIWHYTIGDRLARIMLDGAIRPATANIAPGERPVVWFSANAVWEPTATKGLRGPDGLVRTIDKDELARHDALARIEVPLEVAPYGLGDFIRLSGVSPTTAERLARDPGAHLWRVSFEPVPSSRWKAIEVWSAERKRWEPISRQKPLWER